jgi:hypothetical protein
VTVSPSTVAAAAGTERRRPDSFGWALAVIVAVALVVRIGYVLIVVGDDQPVGDALNYVRLGHGLAHGEGYVRADLLAGGRHVPTAEFPPLWPALLSVPERLGITSPVGLRLVGAVIGAATVAIVGLLGRRVATATIGLVAAGIGAVSPYLVSFDGSLQAEGLYALLVAAFLLLVAVAVTDTAARWRWWVAAGFVLGLAVLTRTEAVLLLPIVVVPVARGGVGPAAWWRRIGVVCIGVAVLLGAWTVRNAVRLHVFQPLTNNSGTLLAGANCDRVYAGYQLGVWRLDCALATDVAGLTETEAAARDRRAAIDFARDHASRVPVVAAARVARTWGAWNPSRQTDYESLEGRPKPWINASWVVGWLLVALAAVGTVVQRRRRRPVWLLVGPVVVATITAAFGYGNSRFRMVAEPGLMVLAAVGLVAGAHRLARAARSRAAVAGAMALVLAACAGAGAQRSQPTTTGPTTLSTTTLPTSSLPPSTAASASTASAAPTAVATTTTLAPAPARAVLIGDSLAYDLAPGVDALLRSGGAGFTDQSFPGLGFSVSTPTWEWRSGWGKVVADTQPDLVLFLAGPWDAHDATVDGAVLSYGSPEWQAWYGRQLDDFVRLVRTAGARLVWLTAPSYDPAAPDAADLTPVNTAFRDVAGRWADVELVDTDTAVDGADGSYAEYLPGPDGPEQIRKADGLHFCPAGATRVAAALLPAIDRWWSFTPAPGWESGPWRQDDRYVHPLYGPGCS